jgi:hypothetical protein
MIINDKYLFVHIQRSGGSFVEKFLLENFDNFISITPKHSGIIENIDGVASACSYLGCNMNNILKFGVVRNPWNWYVSWWSAQKRAADVGGKTMFPGIFFEETLDDFNVFIKHVMTNNFGKQYYFDGNHMQNLGIGAYTYRYLRCHHMNFNMCVVNYVLHQENLREELVTLLDLSPERRKILFDMEDYHVGKYNPFREYYNEESIELVAEKDKFIIENHGYNFS